MMDKQQIMIEAPWYATYVPGIIAYLAGVLSSLGVTRFVKRLIVCEYKRPVTRLFAFIFGCYVTSYLWYHFYGWSFMALLIGIIAGVTAPVTWDIWRSWVTRGTSNPESPDTLDITEPKYGGNDD